MALKTLLLVINPCAGRMEAKHKLCYITEAFTREGYTVTVFPTSKRGDATDIVREHGGEFDRIVCCGGDGTFNEVARGAASLERIPPIGYIPSGTTNDFSKTLGLSENMDENIITAARGEPRMLDSGRLNGRLFNYVASFGVFSDTTYLTKQNLKNMIGNTAYFLYGIGSFLKMKPYKLRIETPEEIFEDEFIFGNVVSSLCVGGLIKIPEDKVSLDDGLFELFLVKKVSKKAIPGLLTRVMSGNFDDPHIIFTRASSVKIIAPADMDWSLDGEYQKGAEKIQIDNIPRSMPIVCNTML